MNYRYLYTITSRSLAGRLLLAIMALMLCMTAVPHHHHRGDAVCVRADFVGNSAESSSLHCGVCCIARSLYYGSRSERTAPIQSVFLLSFLLSSVFLGKYFSRLFEEKHSWKVCQVAFVADESHLSLFGWRAPPFV